MKMDKKMEKEINEILELASDCVGSMDVNDTSRHESTDITD
jgi:hypothetical protein